VHWLLLQQFSDVGHSMLTMFTYALGGVDLDIMLGSSNPEACIVLSLLYQFAMGTVLMSLLTGKAGGLALKDALGCLWRHVLQSNNQMCLLQQILAPLAMSSLCV
jgi:hypothetical protein